MNLSASKGVLRGRNKNRTKQRTEGKKIVMYALRFIRGLHRDPTNVPLKPDTNISARKVIKFITPEKVKLEDKSDDNKSGPDKKLDGVNSSSKSPKKYLQQQ